MMVIIVFAMMMVIMMIMIMIVVVLMRAMTDCFTARPTGKRNPQIKEIRIKNVERTSYDQHAPCKANLFAANGCKRFPICKRPILSSPESATLFRSQIFFNKCELG